MKWLILLAVAANVQSVAVRADEYRLRFETFERISVENSDEDNSNETLHHAIEVVAQPGESFHTKVVIGTRTIVVRGKITRKDDGRFDVQVRHFDGIDTGNFVLIAPDRKRPLLEFCSVSTTVTVVAGTPMTIGQSITKKTEPGKEPTKVERRVVQTLTKVDADDDPI